MNENDKVELDLEIITSDATDEELDRATRQLLSELRELDIDSAELAKGGDAPKGSKGDSVEMGTIVISALPTVLPAVIALVQGWTARGQGRIVKFKSKGIEFEGSPEELHKLLLTLNIGKKK